MNLDTEQLTYPLKIIEMDDFFLNSDDLISKNVFLNTSSNSTSAYTFETDTDTTFKSILLFIDSKSYRINFEKSHLRLISNMVVFDRQTIFKSKEELVKFVNLVSNSKYMLLHGCVEHNYGMECAYKNVKRKTRSNVFQKTTSNLTITDLLLILKSSDSKVQQELTTCFNRLLRNFDSQKPQTDSFEISFEKIIKKYFEEKIRNLHLSDYFKPLKILTSKSNVSFKILTHNSLINKKNFSGSPQSSNIDSIYTSPVKLSGIFEKIKSVFKNKKQSWMNIDENTATTISSASSKSSYSLSSSSEMQVFSIDLLPCLLCFRDRNKIDFFYCSLNDDQFYRIEPDLAESSESLTDKSQIEAISKRIININRFKTYRITKSKSVNCLLSEDEEEKLQMNNKEKKIVNINYMLPSHSPLSSVSSLSSSQQNETFNEEIIFQLPAFVNKPVRSKSYDFLVETEPRFINKKYQQSINHYQSEQYSHRPASIYQKNTYSDKKKPSSDLINLFPEATDDVRSTSYISHSAVLKPSCQSRGYMPQIKKTNAKKNSAVSAYSKYYWKNKYTRGRSSPPPPIVIPSIGLLGPPPPPKILNRTNENNEPTDKFHKQTSAYEKKTDIFWV